MDSKETPETKTIRNTYPIHILIIKLWEWEGIKESSSTSIAKHGPEQHTCEALETAEGHIKELNEALKKLTQ